MSSVCLRRYPNQLPKETIALDPTVIGKIDPASKAVREKERQEELDALRKNQLSNQKKKNTRKLKNHVAKQMLKDMITKEQIRKDTQLRKQLYHAEKSKLQEETLNLNQNMGQIIDLTHGILKKIHDGN